MFLELCADAHAAFLVLCRKRMVYALHFYLHMSDDNESQSSHQKRLKSAFIQGNCERLAYEYWRQVAGLQSLFFSGFPVHIQAKDPDMTR